MSLNFLKKKKIMKKQEENNSVQEEVNTSEEQLISDQPASDAGEQSLPDAEKSEATAEAKLELELSESRDKYLRLYSDFENYKKRVVRDRIEFTKQAGADIYLSMLPVLDDLERALKAMNEADDVEAVKAGLILIYNKMKSNLESGGLKAMESIGKTFDPELHDAITSIGVADDMKGKVSDEIEKGYYLNDKVIRHAKVIVGN
jgi:molecular chaperone GrpE